MFSPDSTFSRFMNTLFDILMIGILWFILSLPLITIAASTTAAYYAMAKVVRHKTGYLFKEFFRSFKANFKQSFLPSLIFIVVAFIAAVDINYVWNNRSKLNDGLFVIIVGIVFLFLSCSIYFCPFLSRFTKRNGELFRLSAFSAFRFLPVTVLVITGMIALIIMIYLMPWAMIIMPGIMFFVLTFPMEYIMKRYMKKPEPGSPEEDMWYFQKTEGFFLRKKNSGSSSRE